MDTLRKCILLAIYGFLCCLGCECGIAAANEGCSEHQQIEVIRHVPTREKLVALTFDDGPSATFTPQILRILHEFHAKATFFVLGSRVVRHPDLVKWEFADGHEIANHSYRHLLMTSQSADSIADELEQTQRVVETTLGCPQPRLFRPPRGKLSSRTLQVMHDKHYAVVLWSVDSGDWQDPGIHRIVDAVTSNVAKGDIVLFHDQGGNRRQTVQALKRILPVLQSRGYRFVTVAELLAHECRTD